MCAVSEGKILHWMKHVHWFRITQPRHLWIFLYWSSDFSVVDSLPATYLQCVYSKGAVCKHKLCTIIVLDTYPLGATTHFKRLAIIWLSMGKCQKRRKSIAALHTGAANHSSSGCREGNCSSAGKGHSSGWAIAGILGSSLWSLSCIWADTLVYHVHQPLELEEFAKQCAPPSSSSSSETTNLTLQSVH